MEINKESLTVIREHLIKNIDIKCKIVVISKNTGTDNTYYITGRNYKDNYFINIAYETDYNSFDNCAFYLNDKTFMLNRYKHTSSLIIRGAYWLLDMIMTNKLDFILEKCILKHTNNCLICNRELTDAESVERGIGKTCLTKSK